jgi:hypothetical protein
MPESALPSAFVGCAFATMLCSKSQKLMQDCKPASRSSSAPACGRSVVRPDIGTGVDPQVVFRPALHGRRRLHEAGVGPAREGREQPDEQHRRRGAAGPWKDLGR